ncbi:hypothetical protein [Phyllobacterium sp. P30BS-XVII]|uniref:hypothetical protein n=1 Tax=Phyllobacterium sp. P30BS-XVII TaxID=2587046 RepID=UPI0013AFC070|nr:hypothetical protein [Phyllobacterium sp. P30BS-XVII]
MAEVNASFEELTHAEIRQCHLLVFLFRFNLHRKEAGDPPPEAISDFSRYQPKSRVWNEAAVNRYSRQTQEQAREKAILATLGAVAMAYDYRSIFNLRIVRYSFANHSWGDSLINAMGREAYLII